MSDFPTETEIAPVRSKKVMDIFSSLCSRLLNDIRACLTSLKTPFGGSFSAMLRCDFLK